MSNNIENENKAYAWLLHSHVVCLANRLRQVPRERWEWQVEVSAPSARILAEHTWQWLVCDRQHIQEPDLTLHPDVPSPPEDQEAMCDILQAEADTWREMILALTPEQFDEPRSQFGDYDTNIRWFICHMIQNCIYKHGQFSTIFFALGLDGTEPYEAPFPNPIYAMIRNPKPSLERL